MNKGLRITGMVVGGFVLVGIGTGIGAAGSGKAATPSPTVTVTAPGPTVTATAPAATVTVTAQPAKPPKPKRAGGTMPGDGTFVVGYAAGDWKPGTWQSGTPSSGNCYSATLSNLSGTGPTSGIINNNNSTGPSVMTVDSSVVGVQVSGCAPWHKIG
jgi:hypothetical protein